MTKKKNNGLSANWFTLGLVQLSKHYNQIINKL